MEVRDIAISEIHADEDFNCRGSIMPIDVVDLAKDIEKHGLQNPLLVDEYNPIRRNETGCTYRLISGYRRYKACQILKKNEVACNVLATVSDTRARILNLGENLLRKDLNITQEAKAIQYLKNAGLTYDDIAKELNQSRGWVQVRYYLLDLPEEIQEAASTGIFSQQQIRDMYSLGSKDRQMKAARVIKERKEKGEKTPAIIKKTKTNQYAKRQRNKAEIFEMMTHIQESIGNNFGTRCLAWASGEIADKDIYNDIAEIAEKEGISYARPQAMLPTLS